MNAFYRNAGFPAGTTYQDVEGVLSTPKLVWFDGDFFTPDVGRLVDATFDMA
jgi:hypothetical protein